jgi:hypothetical protein
MPKIFEWSGYKFFFYSNEGIPREPCHIHIRKGERAAKFWVDPYVSLASSFEMSAKELLLLQKATQDNADLIRSKWNEYFNC